MPERTHGGAPRTRRRINYGDTSAPEGSVASIGPEKVLTKTGDILLSSAISGAVSAAI